MILGSALKSRKYPIAISILALLAGGSFYLFLRNGDFIFHYWIEAIWPEVQINQLILNIPEPGRHYPRWVIYSLPNGLWALAYTLLITTIWRKQQSFLKYFWIGTIPILVVGFELLQYAGWVSGTFCTGDLALGMSGMLLGVLINKAFNHEQAHA